jgi:hypothetical protein
LPNLGLNRRDRLCGIPPIASAQSLDFLDLGQKSLFLNWKRRKVPIFNKTINGWALSTICTGADTNSLQDNTPYDNTLKKGTIFCLNLRSFISIIDKELKNGPPK